MSLNQTPHPIELQFQTVGHDVMDLMFGLPEGTSKWRQEQFDAAREFWSSNILGIPGGIEMADSTLWAKIPWRIPGRVQVSCLAWVPVETSAVLRAEPDLHIDLDTVRVHQPRRASGPRLAFGGRMSAKAMGFANGPDVNWAGLALDMGKSPWADDEEDDDAS